LAIGGCISEEEHIIFPVLWDISDLNVLFDGLIKILELSLESFSFWRSLEIMQALVEGAGLLGLAKILECIFVVVSPVSFFEFFELSINIISLIFNDLNSLIIDVDTVLGFLDVLI